MHITPPHHHSRLPLLALLLILAAFAVEGTVRIPFPGDVHPPESAFIAPVYLAAHGQPLYQSIDRQSFILLYYPPLYFWLILAATRIGHLGAYGMAVCGRLLGLAFALLAAWFLVRLRRNELVASDSRGRLSYTVPFIAPLAFALVLANPLLLRWALMVRPDTGAIAFSVLGLLCGWHALHTSQSQKQTLWLAASLLAFGAALGFKQTALAAPGAFFLFAISQRRTRLALSFALFFILLVICGFGFLRLACGPDVFRNVLATVSVRYRIANWFRPLDYSLRDSIAILLLLGIWAGTIWHAQKQRPPQISTRFPLSLTGLYLLCAFLFALVSSGKSGSSMNYYIEPAMIAGVLAERPLAYLLQQWRTRRWMHAAAWALLLIVAGNLWLRPYTWHKRDDLGHFRSADALLQQLHGRFQNGLVLASEAHIALLAGRRPVLEDSFIFSAMRQTGSWSPAPLHQMIATHQFAALIFDFRLGKDESPIFQDVPLWPADTVQLLLRHYHLTQQCDGWFIYQPIS